MTNMETKWYLNSLNSTDTLMEHYTNTPCTQINLPLLDPNQSHESIAGAVNGVWVDVKIL